MKTKNSIITTLLILTSQWAIAQCILSGTLAFNTQQLKTYLSSNCPNETELVVANNAVISINAGWDLTGTNITTLRIQGNGSIEFGNSDDIAMSANSTIIIEDVNNETALKVVGSNTSTIQIIIGETVYNASSFGSIISSGGVNVNGFLDVELTAFAVNLDDEYVSLTWETASEDNNWGFEVQRSNDLENWETLDFIEGQGTTTATTNYEFKDYYPKGGNNYYRLKIIEFDEDFELSPVVVISLRNKSGTIISIGPNPAQNYLNVSTDELGNNTNTLRILNTEGKSVLETNWEYLTRLDISQLPAGFYLVENTSDNKTTVQKLLIQR